MPLAVQHTLATVVSNELIIPDHRVIRCIVPEIARQAQPGHFVNVLVADTYDPFLRKPFSIFTVDRAQGELSLLFSIVGATTRGMARKRPGETLDMVGPLGGRLFRPDPRPAAVHIMVGGGYGVPPLVFLSRELLLSDPLTDLHFVVGARDKELLLCEAELHESGVQTYPTTENGSHGLKGRVTDALVQLLDAHVGKAVTVYCCGPTPMMRAVGELCLERATPCQLSVEVAMPCGVGVCMGCVIDLADGRRVRSCTEGPVFEAGEVTW